MAVTCAAVTAISSLVLAGSAPSLKIISSQSMKPLNKSGLSWRSLRRLLIVSLAKNSAIVLCPPECDPNREGLYPNYNRWPRGAPSGDSVRLAG